MPIDDPHFVVLCDRVVLVVWSLTDPVDGPSTLTGSFGEAVTPLSCLRLALENGGTRIIWALARPAEDTAIMMVATGGIGSTAVEFDTRKATAVDQTIFAGLTGPARLSLAAAMLSTWASLFQLQRDPGFLGMLHKLLTAPGGAAGRVQAIMGVDTAVVVETPVPEKFGACKSGYLISQSHIKAVKPKSLSVRGPDRERGMRRFFLDHAPASGDYLLVLRGENGLVVRAWSTSQKPQSPETWWRKGGHREPGLRQEVITLFNTHSDGALAASIEFQLRCPLKPVAVAGSPVLPSAGIEVALAGQSGLLMGGWYRDPSGFIEGFDLLGADDKPLSIDDERIEFAGKVAGPEKEAIPATGFIGFSTQIKGPLLQPRFLMRLKSGVRHLLTPPVQPLDWTGARAAALRSVPPQALTDHVIANCLAPIIGEFQQAAKASIGTPTVQQIGTPVDDPLVSIVIPLYKVLDFLPFQIAAFASDPQILFRCEIIYVLDSPEQADAVAHLLTGLNLVYGLPITLAVMPRNGGFAIANNRAASLARGKALTLLNSDVIPIKAGWVGELTERLNDESVGAVGPKLLFEDDSIQHAGLFFDRDHRGRWLNHHYYKGMPRHYRPANSERSVPGVTGACVVMRRALFEAVGGFTEDYVIGDYEDSDLCLKVRATGRDIVYVPSAELYHLERRSMTQSSDYMRGVASQYNSWLHQQRWDAAMTALMAVDAKSDAQTRRVA
ncbi:glycosyltransferase family 2 protein [uncultured Devosia sp.]|uniref:glycosyltransferase family 2 protein n=1 Tax=uncultured Devosia sp. TaxID=211434 RepID=UPI0035CA8D5D